MKKVIGHNFNRFVLLISLVFLFSCQPGDEISEDQTELRKISLDTAITHLPGESAQMESTTRFQTHTNTPVTLDLYAEEKSSRKKYQFQLTGNLNKEEWAVFAGENGVNPEIELPDGEYEILALLNGAKLQYVFQEFVRIGESTTVIDLSGLPISGTQINQVDELKKLHRLSLQTNDSSVDLSDSLEPSMSIQFDDQSESFYTINPNEISTDLYLNYPNQTRQIKTKLYDGSFQKGVSLQQTEEIKLNEGEQTTVMVENLNIETQVHYSSDKKARFTFKFPPVISEGNAPDNTLQLQLSIVSQSNDSKKESKEISAQTDETSFEYNNFQPGSIFYSLNFFSGDSEFLGYCFNRFFLKSKFHKLRCRLKWKCKKFISGRLLSTVGVNVFNSGDEPMEGAFLFANNQFLGLTGSGLFGTKGYLKSHLIEGDYQIKAWHQGQYAFLDITPDSLDLYNHDLNLENWVYKLPDSGQTNSYSEIFGEDADYTINPKSFTDLGNGSVIDNNTQLVWQKEDDNKRRKWTRAQEYCGNLSLANQSNWRLPTQLELMQIVEYDKRNPSIDSSTFPGTKSRDYWTASSSRKKLKRALSVRFSDGSSYLKRKRRKAYTRCVSGFNGLMIFEDNLDGTVSDQLSGLTWQQNNAYGDWESGLDHCENLVLAGKSDWRVPSINELATLTNKATDPPVGDGYFEPSSLDRYWSSTSKKGSSRKWIVDLTDGRIKWASKYRAYSIRCVRSD